MSHTIWIIIALCGLWLVTVVLVWKLGSSGGSSFLQNAPPWLALVTSLTSIIITIYQIETQQAQFAAVLGEPKYVAFRNANWTVCLEQLTGQSLVPRSFVFLPQFQQAANAPPTQGEEVERDPREYAIRDSEGLYFKIPAVDQLVCLNQPAIDCKKASLIHVDIKFTRDGKSYGVPVIAHNNLNSRRCQ